MSSTEDPTQPLFDAANAQVAAGTFTEAAWRSLLDAVEARVAGLDPELAAVCVEAAAQMGATAGFYDDGVVASTR